MNEYLARLKAKIGPCPMNCQNCQKAVLAVLAVTGVGTFAEITPGPKNQLTVLGVPKVGAFLKTAACPLACLNSKSASEWRLAACRNAISTHGRETGSYNGQARGEMMIPPAYPRQFEAWRSLESKARVVVS